MFECQACKAKDDEIKHLRALVDSMLIGKGLTPVSAQAVPAEPIEVKEEIFDPANSTMTTHGGLD